ncbi:MAG: hypothetical protein ACRD2T_09760 [Thermoanaerobaculia bacterium]
MARFRPLLPRLPLLAALVALPGPLAARDDPSGKAAADAAAEAVEYIRFVPEGKNAGRLETAVATFEGAQGVEVHLVAAVHVGDRRYYEELNRLFEGYEALLYEMIKDGEAAQDPPKRGEGPPVPAGKSEESPRSQSLLSVFQRGLKDVLGLEFQLDAVDYSRKNFVHADMNWETFSKLQKERGENLLTLMLRVLLDDLRRQSQGDDAGQISGIDLLKVFLSRDRSRSLKLLLARQFKDIEGRLASIEGEKGSVIVAERNKVALSVLRKALDGGKKRVGIFYGGAHMPDMERRLVEAFGLKRKSVRWLVAWDLPAPPPPPAKEPAEEPR